MTELSENFREQSTIASDAQINTAAAISALVELLAKKKIITIREFQEEESRRKKGIKEMLMNEMDDLQAESPGDR